LVTGALALVDGGLQPYAAFGNVSGSATVQAFNKTASVPAGWRVTPTANWLFATEYFGPGSTWVRYRIMPAHSKNALYADVVLTFNKASLDTYNVVNSVLFRNYAIRTWQRIDLGDGVYGLVLNYSDPASHRMWASVSWVWPVLNQGLTYYERIVLTSPSVTGVGRAAGAQLAGGVHDVFLTLLNDVSGGRSDPSIQAVYHNTDAALEATAEILVRQAVQTRS
jgi:hypothetical protein